MESQTIQELEALTPTEMVCIPLRLIRITAFTNRHGMPPSGS